jgi:hypothetical protein
VNPLDLIPLNRNWYGASLVRGHGRASRTSGAR